MMNGLWVCLSRSSERVWVRLAQITCVTRALVRCTSEIKLLMSVDFARRGGARSGHDEERMFPKGGQ